MNWEQRTKEIKEKWNKLSFKRKLFLWILAIIDIILLLTIYVARFIRK